MTKQQHQAKSAITIAGFPYTTPLQLQIESRLWPLALSVSLARAGLIEKYKIADIQK